MALSFKIDFPIQPFRIIEPESRILLIGSCFTESIGERLKGGGLTVNINPFGILYNPQSIAQAILRISQKSLYAEEDLYKNHEGRYVSFDHHGRYSGFRALDVLEKINSSIENAHNFLRRTDCIIITLGSAWVYKLIKNNKVVANCHKVPAKQFSKTMLELSEISGALQLINKELCENFPELNIIYTISPVKHLRDGVVENTRSKSALVLACMQLMATSNDKIHYFPSFEIVTEELRDYRFYEKDHAHPNTMAIEYIWERFSDTCFKEATLQKLKDTQQLVKALEHRGLHEKDSVNTELENKIKEYLNKHPKVE